MPSVFTPEELINLSLESLIEVEGLSRVNGCEYFITKYFNGIQPLRPCRIPLYLALHLEKMNKARIIKPSYYSKGILDDIISSEKDETGFTMLPDEYFFEVANILKITDPRIQQITIIRRNKLWHGIKEMDGKAVLINNLTRWEFNEVKELILGAMRIGNDIINTKDE